MVCVILLVVFPRAEIREIMRLPKSLTQSNWGGEKPSDFETQSYNHHLTTEAGTQEYKRISRAK
jgi:hypothetical protein